MPDSFNLPPAPPTIRRVAFSALVFALAVAAYHATLLPSLDFGDTAAYQTAVGDWRLTPRQAYPLYFALANSLFALTGGDPARSLNLFSALAGAAACAITVWLASGLTGSLAAGVWAGVMLGASYTFWSQAVIGEVYTLHLALVALTLCAGMWWSRQPTWPRLATLFGLYAIGFGNHLMMILLAPALVALLVLTPEGRRQVLSGRAVALAGACAAAGAAQYLWNAAYLWQIADPSPSVADALATFWFDVTKSDWRSTMVMGVHETALKRRMGLYWFELLQQIGAAGVALALLGLCSLWWRWRLLTVLAIAYLTAFAFAYTYNVGDVHVFFLPSHQVVILTAAFGVATVTRPITQRHLAAGAAVVALALAWPMWRAWDTWPAVDRHDDQRPRAWLDALTRGLGRDGLLIADINWQLENGLGYYARHVNPDLMVVRAADRALTLPWLILDNLAAGRLVAMTPQSRSLTEASYGTLFTFDPDPSVDARPLLTRIGRVEPGTVYVLAQLAPYKDVPYDPNEVAETARYLTDGAASLGDGPSYQVLAGRAGRPPLLDRRTTAPFRSTVTFDELTLEIRMESWLPADTMRRAGFGHVIANRRHALTLERGVSLVLFGPNGEVRQTAYASALLAPLPRFLVRASSTVQ